MILAAGFGQRMRPLTEHTPKPLLRVAGQPLIAHHLQRLRAAGVREVVVNIAHLGEQIRDYCGDGSRWGLSIAYSREEQPLETAGGIQRALPRLGAGDFLVVNGDIWSDYDFHSLLAGRLRARECARLLLVDNPPQHARGDFALDEEAWVRARRDGARSYTYAGIGLYSPALFAGLSPGRMPLRPLLDEALGRGELGGEYYRGQWQDVGTPQRLRALDTRLRGASAS